MNVIDFNQSISDAVDNPKFHHQWLPDQVMVENNFPLNTSESLKKMGYIITNRGQIGRTEVIRIDWRKNKITAIEAVADKRGDDHASAY